MKKYKSKKRTAEEIQKLIDRYERGETLREIGESEDLTCERVRQIFEQAGHKRRRKTTSKKLTESFAKRVIHLPRAELERLASRPSIDSWLEQVRKRKRASQTRISANDILQNRDADRR